MPSKELQESLTQAILDEIERLGFRKNGIACVLASDAAEKIALGLSQRGTMLPGNQEEVMG
jgi:hypothetical protein